MCFALIHLLSPLYSHPVLPPQTCLWLWQWYLGHFNWYITQACQHTHTCTNTMASWVLSTNNFKSLMGYRFGTELLDNEIQVPMLEGTQWWLWKWHLSSIFPLEKCWVGIKDFSFQFCVCCIISDAWVPLPISLVLKAHFSSFSPVTMIASFPLSNLITYFYIFAAYYVFLLSLFHMNEQHTLSSASKCSPSFFSVFFYGDFLNLIS